jgi:malonyl CoA-acyl carrier protein transacylase
MGKKTYVFPGQGKKFGRAEIELLKRNEKVEKLAGDILGYSVTDKIEKEPDEIKKTEYAQPIGYITAFLYYQEMIAKKGKAPDFVIGHSLGELCALTAGGYIDFERGIDLVRKRGQIMSGADGGTMSAVIGRKYDRIMTAITENISEEIDIANYNSPFQVVISGPEIAIAQAEEKIAATGLKVVRLKVSGAFHSRYMKGACDSFRKKLENFSFGKGNETLVMSSVSPELYQENVPVILGNQIVKPVRWIESIEKLIDMDCYDFVQVDGGHSMIDMIDDIKFARALKGRQR